MKKIVRITKFEVYKNEEMKRGSGGDTELQMLTVMNENVENSLV